MAANDAARQESAKLIPSLRSLIEGNPPRPTRLLETNNNPASFVLEDSIRIQLVATLDRKWKESKHER